MPTHEERAAAERSCHAAASKGDLAALTQLVERGVDVDATDEASAAAPHPPIHPPTPAPTPLPLPHIPSSAPPHRYPYGRPHCVVSSRAHSPPDRAQAGFTALMMAAARAHCNCVDYLLAVGADVNAQTKVSK